MVVIEKSEVVQELLKVLGLQDKRVVNLNLNISLDSIVTIQIERYLTKEEALQMLPVLERYKLVKKEE